MMAVHMLDLRDMGLIQGQLWHLDELAADSPPTGSPSSSSRPPRSNRRARRRRTGGADGHEVAIEAALRPHELRLPDIEESGPRRRSRLSRWAS